jgi:hypothetical protein
MKKRSHDRSMMDRKRSAGVERAAAPVAAASRKGGESRRRPSRSRSEENKASTAAPRPAKGPERKPVSDPVSRIVVAVDDAFEVLKAEVQPDDRGRVSIGQDFVGSAHYRILRNALGQIVLDPVVTIPATELWLFQNPQALGAVMRGVQQARSGEISSLGSFAKFAKEPIDDEESE